MASCVKEILIIIYLAQSIAAASFGENRFNMNPNMNPNMDPMGSDLMRRLNEAYSKLSAMAQNTIAQFSRDTMQGISKFKAQYEDSPIMKPECVTSQEETFRIIAEDAMAGITSVVTGKVREAEGIVMGISGDLSNAQATVRDAVSTVQGCGTAQALCAGSEGVVVASGAVKTALSIYAEAAEAVNLVMGLEGDLVTCAAKEAANVVEKLGMAGLEIAKCSGA